MKKILVFVFCLLSMNFVFSQELRCKVELNTQKIQDNSRDVFESLKKDITEFMNSTKWTDNVFSPVEQIDCQIQIVITGQSGDNFTGTVYVQARRPVFNTNYTTLLLDHKEKESDFQFEYVKGQSLLFNLNSFSSSLTSVLGFYAYLIIGLDYDSFSENGGKPYFEKAMLVASNARTASKAGTGWQPSESRTNRYALIDNLTTESLSQIHTFLYRYHRLGLDVMADKIETGRAEIADDMNLLNEVYKKKPNSFIMDVLFNAKADEIVNIFKPASSTEQQKVINVVKVVNPANMTKYESLLKKN